MKSEGVELKNIEHIKFVTREEDKIVVKVLVFHILEGNLSEEHEKNCYIFIIFVVIFYV